MDTDTSVSDSIKIRNNARFTTSITSECERCRCGVPSAGTTAFCTTPKGTMFRGLVAKRFQFETSVGVRAVDAGKAHRCLSRAPSNMEFV